MELQELFPALLQPQVTAVAILGELLATLPRLEEMVLGVVSAVSLYSELEQFTKDLWSTLCCFDDTWRRRGVTSDGDNDPPTFLSHALATYESSSWITWDDVTMAASEWQGSVAALGDSWARLAREATKLHKAWWEVATKAADVVATATARARELQDEVAHDGTAQEDMVALAGEEGTEVVARYKAWVTEQATEAASWATRATVVRQRVVAALGLLERLVAACDKATAFPLELQRRVGDIRAALEGTNEAPRDVPKDLVAQVAVAERLWEASAHLAKGHLEGTLDDIIRFYFNDAPDRPGGCGVAERCLRATEDIPRLLRPQSVPKVSPVATELRELSPPQVLVAVVATLGEVVATVTGPRRDTPGGHHESSKSLHEELRRFTRSLCKILEHGDVTSPGHRGVTSLSWALATLRATPGTTWASVRATATTWRDLVAKLVDSWDWLAREATKLCDTTAQQLMVALDKEEVALEMATHDVQVVAATNEVVVATRLGMVATRRGHWAEVALGPLQRLVATCDKATLFNWSMEWRLRDIEAILKGTKEVSPDVLQALVAKVAKFEMLWEASARLAKDHLLGTLGDIHNILCGGHGGPGGPSSRAVAKRCQKAIEDIPRLLWGQ